MRQIKSDIDLLAALMQDKEVAFTEIYKRYQPSLYEVCMKYIKNEDTANDVVQSVFMWLWENRKDLTIDTNLRSYLCTTTKNKILNLLRHENVIIQNNYAYAQQRQNEDTWLEKMQHEGQIKRVKELIEELPGQRKQICKMKIEEQLSNQQIADALGISLQTVKNQYTSSIKSLREKFIEQKQKISRLG